MTPPKYTRLTPTAIATELAKLTGWHIAKPYRLTKTVHFDNFADALAFTNHVGAIAETLNHHPDIHLTWGRVTITIWTHTINGLTALDFTFARQVDALPHPNPTFTSNSF